MRHDTREKPDVRGRQPPKGCSGVCETVGYIGDSREQTSADEPFSSIGGRGDRTVTAAKWFYWRQKLCACVLASNAEGNSWLLDWQAYRTRYRDIPKPATWRQRASASTDSLRPGSAGCLQAVPGRCRAGANPLDDGGRHFRAADRRESRGRDEVDRSAAGRQRRFDRPLDRHCFLLRLQRVA